MTDRNTKNVSGQDGFSLLEVLIAIVILSVGLVSVAAMQISAIQGNARSNVLTTRTAVAANHMERLISLPYDDALLAAGSHTPQTDGDDNDGDGVVDEADDDGEFNYTVSWTVVDDTASQKTIVVTIVGSSTSGATTTRIRTIKVR